MVSFNANWYLLLMSEQSKHREISTVLLSEIAAGKYAASGRLPSEVQLVKRFGVSRPTVARALRDLQAQGLIVRRAGSGTYVKEQAPPGPPPPARQLALMIPGFRSTEIFELICGELANLARAHDYTLVWGGAPGSDDQADETEQRALELCEQLIERRVAGVLFAPFELRHQGDAANRAIAARFEEAGVPVVLLDRDLGPFPTRCGLDLVGIDNFTAGYLIAEHLLELGCRKIAFLRRPLAAATIDARVAGVREALARRELQLATEWLDVAEPEDAKSVGELLQEGKPDAVVCANDLTAAQLLRSLAHNGVRVPQDMRVVGFDDAKYATLVGVPLTTIHQPCRDIAVTAFRALLERIAEPTLPARSLLLAPRLVVRESCGAYQN
jgi:DNA-binding LacI/PurR family transcriptional regulator